MAQQKRNKKGAWLGLLLLFFGLIYIFRRKTPTTALVQRNANYDGGYLNTAFAPSYNTGGGVSNGSGAATTIVVPSSPTGTAATTTSSPLKNTITWSAGSGATNYIVQRSTTASGPFSSIATALTGTSYDDTTATAGTQYFYNVIAENSAGTSSASANASITTATQVVVAPAAPTGVAATTTASPLKNTITWAATSGATSYIVQRGTAASGPFTSISSGLNATTYDDSTAAAGTQYFYNIIAVNSGGNSPASANTSITTATPAASSVTVQCETGTGSNASLVAITNATNASGGQASARLSNPGESWTNNFTAPTTKSWLLEIWYYSSQNTGGCEILIDGTVVYTFTPSTAWVYDGGTPATPIITSTNLSITAGSHPLMFRPAVGNGATFVFDQFKIS